MEFKRAPPGQVLVESHGDFCAPNIGGRQVLIRRASGVVSFAVAIVLFAALLYNDAAPLWRLTVFLPAISGFFGWLQAQEKT